MAEFPSWRFGPDGQKAVFDRAEDVPAGWEDHPCKVKQPTIYDVAKVVSDAAAQIAKFDPDGDGRIGGSLKGKRKPRQKAVKRDLS